MSKTSEFIYNDQKAWIETSMKLYIQWYTFFVTANLVIMGWFAKDLEHGHNLYAIVPYLFSFLNILGAISGSGVVFHLIRAGKKLQQASYEIAKTKSGFAIILAAGAFLFNVIGLIGIAIVWIYIGNFGS